MAPMSRKFAVAAGISAAALGGAAIAGAASGPSGSPSASKRAEHHQDEKALTGDIASKVKAAALAKLPGGKVLRVESDRGGVYQVWVLWAECDGAAAARAARSYQPEPSIVIASRFIRSERARSHSRRAVGCWRRVADEVGHDSRGGRDGDR